MITDLHGYQNSIRSNTIATGYIIGHALTTIIRFHTKLLGNSRNVICGTAIQLHV